MASDRLLTPHRNCWRIEDAERVAFLIDGESYFKTLYHALQRAERWIGIVGWEFHSLTRLIRDSDALTGAPAEVGPLLLHLAERNPRLQVHNLQWDWAMVFAFEREIVPIFQLPWKKADRVHFHYDGEHPPGGSHHQKIVVIDDKLAFIGGLDLTAHRWDSREHRLDDERRKNPHGKPYRPFHDVQLALQGPVAAALGDLIRERWWRATGEQLEVPSVQSDPWPEGLEAGLASCRIGIARTRVRHGDLGEVREIEKLYADSIRTARGTIYLENQYFTSHAIGEMLAERLREADGPEVVVVTQSQESGWLEKSTLGVLRARLLERLRDADTHGRFRVYFPVLGGGDAPPVKIHSKIAVIDDRLLRVGSANLTNRSMGLDSECDVAIEAADDEPQRRQITAFRDSLLAEHLGVGPEVFAEAVRDTGRVGEAIERLRGDGRTLAPLEVATDDVLDTIMPDSQLLDPEKPLSAETILDELAHDEVIDEGTRHPFLRVAAVVVVLAALAAAWRFTPLGDALQWSDIEEWVRPLSGSIWGGPVVILGFVAGGLLVLPVTAMIAATASIFAPWWAFLYALAGCLAGASVIYGIGRLLLRDTVRRLSGRRLKRINRLLLGNKGIGIVVALRVVPVAPFTVVNLVMGATRVPFRTYLLGTLIGMTPGVLLMTALANRAIAAFRDPSVFTILTALAALGALAGVGALLRKKLGQKVERDSKAEPADSST